MIRAPRLVGVNTVLAVFIASLCALAVGGFFALLRLETSLRQQALYAGAAFLASGAMTALCLATFMKRGLTTWGVFGRTILMGALSGIFTAEALVVTNVLLSSAAITHGADVWGPMLGLGVVGAVIGAVGGFVSAPAFLFARDPTVIDVFDRVLFLLALIVAPLAAFGAYREAQRGSFGGIDGQVVLGVVAVGFVVTLVRDVRRRAWLRDLPGFRLEPAEEGEVLPSYITRGHDVLVEEAAGGGGPFRAGVTATRVARIDRKNAGRWLAARLAVASMVVVAAGASEPWLAARRAAIRVHEHRSPAEHPLAVAGIVDATDLTMADDYGCAHSGADHVLRCWGNEAGVVFHREPGQWEPIALSPGNVGRAYASREALCTLDSAAGPGQARCATTREPERGFLGAGPPNVVALAQGRAYTLGLTASGEVYGWGDLSGLVAEGLRSPDHVGVEKFAVKDIRQIAASDTHACALDAVGEVYCWGIDRYGAVSAHESPLFANDAGPVLPRKVEGIPRADRITLGPSSSWAHTPEGWYAWGWSGDRRRGFKPGDAENEQPALVISAEKARDLVVTEQFTCALSDDRSVQCFAESSYEKAHLEMDGLPPGSALEIAASRFQVCARREHDVVCWGPHG